MKRRVTMSIVMPFLCAALLRPPDSSSATRDPPVATQAESSLTGVTLRFVSAWASGGNGDDLLSDGECFDLHVELHNAGATAAESLTATLVAVEPGGGITIAQPTSSYPDIAPGASASNTTAFKVNDLYSHCGIPIHFELTVTALGGYEFVLPFELQTPTVNLKTTFSYAGPPLPIPDKDPAGVEVPIEVTSSFGDLAVGVYITHESDADLGLTLIAPDGRTVRLSPLNAVSGQDYGTSCDRPTWFDDRAETLIEMGTAPFVGVFAPLERLASLLGDRGSPLGVWKLRVVDGLPRGVGTLNCWSIGAFAPYCGPAIDARCPAPASLSIAMSTSSPTAHAGEPVTYALTVRNTGPLAAANVVVSDPSFEHFPGISLFPSAVPSQGVCYLGLLHSPIMATCVLGTIAPSASATIAVTALVDCDVSEGAILRNDARVKADTDDPDPSDNVAALDLAVEASTTCGCSPGVSLDEVECRLQRLVDIVDGSSSLARLKGRLSRRLSQAKSQVDEAAALRASPRLARGHLKKAAGQLRLVLRELHSRTARRVAEPGLRTRLVGATRDLIRHVRMLVAACRLRSCQPSVSAIRP